MTDRHRPRTIAIGDIHGCSTALASILQAVNPQPADTIVTLGDYVNRGPDARGVLDQLVQLAQRCCLVPLLGNHDETLLDVLDGRFEFDRLHCMGGDATLESYGPGATLEAIPAEHVDLLRSCYRYFETDTHFFVHANYAPNLPLENTDGHTLLWLSLRDFVPGRHFSGRKAILGHTPQEAGEPLDLGHLIGIDTGCAYGGNLTALSVDTGDIWQVNQAGDPL